MNQGVEEIFRAARERLTAADRSAYLDGACGTDLALRAKVEELLRADAEAGLPVTGADRSDVDATIILSHGAPPDTPHEPSSEIAGQMIGRYELLQQIGEGGFGSVWMAEQREPVVRKVALKIIKLGMDTQHVIARFEQERQALALMDHPNIARVLDAGATGTGRPFFVMELCAGDSITEYCDENNLSIPERLGLFVQVCQAVQHAHQKGLIHRDIKPTNILVATQDGKPHAKVIDFGIAKATASKLTEKTLFTQHRQLVGTPHYMSPEQAEGSLDIDTRTDVYSLGVLLYELLTGTTPFDRRSLQTATIVDLPRIIREIEPPHPSTRVRSMISSRVAPPSTDAATVVRDADSPGPRAGWSLEKIAAHRRIEPGKLLANIRGELDWIVMKAMEKDRTRRYETATALAADIKHHLDNEPVTARPPSTRYLLSKFVRRHRKSVIAGAVIVGALVLGTIGTTVGMLWAINEKARATLAADTAERAAYRAGLLSAAHAIEDQRMDAAGALLAATAPRLRGWEYRHLASRLDRSLPSPLPADWRIRRLARSTGAADFAVLRMARDGRTTEWVVLDHDLRSERLVVPGVHADAFAVSPDGTRAIWAPPPGPDPRVFTLWDIGARKALAIVPLVPTRPPAEPSIALTWSPAGDRFLVSSASGFEVRDGRSGALQGRVVVQGWAYWTADDRWIFVRGTVQNARFDWKKCRLFDSRTLAPQPSVLELASAAAGVPTLAFAPSRVAIPLQDGTVHVLEIVDGVLHERSKLPGEGVAWSHDGRLIAVGSSVYSMSAQGEGRVRVWDADSGALHGDFAGPGSGVQLMFLPDSGDLLTVDGAGHHHVLPITSGSPGVLTAHRSFVYPLALTKDGGTLLSGGWDGASGFSGGLKLWDARTGTLVAEHGRPGEIFYSADLTPDGRYAVAGVRLDSGESLGSRVIDLATGEVRTTFRPQDGSEPDHTLVHPDGRRVLSPYRSGETYLWDLVTGKVLWETDLKSASVNRNPEGHGAAAISPDGRLLALADEGISIRLVDANTLQDVRRWVAHADNIWSLSFSPDGKWLLSPSDDDTVGVWEVATGKPVARLVGHNADVLCAAMSPDGTRIASGGRDGYVRLWDTTHFDNVAQLGGHTSYLYSLAWSPDGRQLISSSGDHTVRIWDTRTLAEEVEARRARTEALPPLEARVARARAKAPDPGAAVATLIASPELDARERELVQQVAMRFALDGMPAYYRAPRAATPIVIDGRIDEAAWNASPWSEPFVDIEGDSKPRSRFETRMRMLWDDTYLYVAARLEEPHVWATLSRRDDIVYGDNDFEVFVDPEGDGRWYGEVEINALGAVFDLLLDGPYSEGGRPHTDWSPPGLRAAVSVDGTLNDPSDVDRGWTVEIAIPHAALADRAKAPLPPRPGDVWRINFSRVEWQHHVVARSYVKRPGTREDNWVWTPQHTVDMHRPREWGFVEFVRDPQ